MQLPSLTFKGIRARPVLLQLERPVVVRIATIRQWPLILNGSTITFISAASLLALLTVARPI